MLHISPYYAEQNVYLFFQEEVEDLPRADQTLHLLSKCVRHTSADIRRFLPLWVDSHDTWCRKVSKKYLKKRNMSYKQFVKEFLHPAFPLDLFAIGIFARAYKKHVAVFYEHNYWCTEVNLDLNKCHVFLEYCGHLSFHSTRRMHSWEYNTSREIIQKYQKILDVEQAEKEQYEYTSSSESSDEDSYSRVPVIPSDDEAENGNIMLNLSTGSSEGQRLSASFSEHSGNIMQRKNIPSVSEGPITSAADVPPPSDSAQSITPAADVPPPSDSAQSMTSAADVPPASVTQETSTSVADVPITSVPNILEKDTSVNIMRNNNSVLIDNSFVPNLRQEIYNKVDNIVRDVINPEMQTDVESDEGIDLEAVLESGKLPRKSTKRTKRTSVQTETKIQHNITKIIQQKPIRKSNRLTIKKKKDKALENLKQLTPKKVVQQRSTKNSLKTKYSEIVKNIVRKPTKAKVVLPIFDMQPLVSPVKRKRIFKM